MALESRCPHSLLQNPNLSACIHVDSLDSIKPDMDIQPTGQYQIFQLHLVPLQVNLQSLSIFQMVRLLVD